MAWCGENESCVEESAAIKRSMWLAYLEILGIGFQVIFVRIVPHGKSPLNRHLGEIWRKHLEENQRSLNCPPGN